MNNKKAFYFGSINKTETVDKINIPNVTNHFILESRSPFLGYYDDYPGVHNNASYLYLVLDKRYTFVELHAHLVAAKKKLDTSIDMVHASLYINQIRYTAIRIRGFEKTTDIFNIIDVLETTGLEFEEDRAKFTASECHTQISKYFFVKKKDKGLWKDKIANHHAYIKLPQRYTPDEFKEVIQHVKNNWTRHSFDAASVIFGTPDKSIEALRIYSKDVWEKGYIEELQSIINSKLK